MGTTQWAMLKNEQQREKLHLINVKGKEIITKTALLNLAHTRFGRFLRVLVIGSMTGFILSLLGFILWYRRLQRFQDMFTRRQALSNENTAEREKI